MKILVTGGLGYIGSHTAIELMAGGHEPLIIDNLDNSELSVLDRIEAVSGRRPAFTRLDLRDQPATAAYFRANPGIDAVIHFAAKKAVGESVEQPLAYYDNNLGGLVSLLAGMGEAGVRDLVFSSSCTVYGQPEELPIREDAPVVAAASPYGNTKQICEEIIGDVARATPLRAILLRYFNPIGAHPSARIGESPKGVPQNLVPYLTQAVAGVRDELKVYGDDYDTPDGSAIRDYIHIMDLASAHVAALDHFPRMGPGAGEDAPAIFNVGTGSGSSVFEVIAAFQRATGLEVPRVVTGRRAGDVQAVWADCGKIEQVLGWRTRYSLEQALESAWRWQQRCERESGAES